MNCSKLLFLQLEKCPGGGIGRRVGLKHQWCKPCRFEPGPGYKSRNNVSAFYIPNIYIKIIRLYYLAPLYINAE